MDPTYFIVAAAAAALFFFKRGSADKADQKKEDVVPPITKPSDPPNGVYPDAGMTLAEAQKILINLGYDLGKWGADNKYGASTRAALIAYQASQGLAQHGFLDRTTADALRNATSTAVPAALYSDVGYQRGYERGMTGRGLGYDFFSACSAAGAVAANGGQCPDDFKAGYDRGFTKGGFDAGFQEGAAAGSAGAPLEAVLGGGGTGDSFKKGARAGWISTYAGDVSEDGSDVGVAGLVIDPKRARAVASRAAGR